MILDTGQRARVRLNEILMLPWTFGLSANQPFHIRGVSVNTGQGAREDFGEISILYWKNLFFGRRGMTADTGEGA